MAHCPRSSVLSSPIQCSSEQGREELLTAAVERGPSEGARSGSKESSPGPCALPFPACAFREEEKDQAGWVGYRIR